MMIAADPLVSSALEKSRPGAGGAPSVEKSSALTREARSRTGAPDPATVTLDGLISIAPSRSNTSLRLR